MAVKLLTPTGDFPACGLIRRLAVAGYDLLLLLAVLMVVTFGYLGIYIGFYGEAAAHQQADAGGFVGDHVLSLIVLLVTIGFYLTFWTIKGQTLGMQAWRIRLQQTNGYSITRKQALIRLAVCQVSWLCAGLGFFWQFWDKRSRTWHDMASSTELVVLPKGTFKQ
ncbi:MAG TPA: RDD family protein [Pseudomonas sabulinigri]|uniref:RDD domain-containing protein n=1 Tax=marine sediment metagenome TaxID=412755 RepID=A0A0F9ULZ4_9ZZZZ|nr:RDD family protein [Halopseudomonas sabulinigri]HEC52905.1 RDD family protein [Halopseudomonas sabulinigri]|tara:strand:- start:332 stop:826 length:495 start_codon:yes stop_codon:yes gene_type:complete